jgi:hypothetical protein
MATILLKGNGQLRTGRVALDVPHLGNPKTFMLPLIGPDTHGNVMSEIDRENLYRPTTAEVFSLVNLALRNPKEPHCATIIYRFRNNCLWTATETLSFRDGVIVYDNIDGKMPKTSRGLLQLIEAGDRRVRLLKPDFKTGCMSLVNFLKNPYTIAQVGEEMISVVERVAKACHKTRAGILSLEKQRLDIDANRQTAVCLDKNRGSLVLDGCYRGYSNGGYCSGLKS